MVLQLVLAVGFLLVSPHTEEQGSPTTIREIDGGVICDVRGVSGRGLIGRSPGGLGRGGGDPPFGFQRETVRPFCSGAWLEGGVSSLRKTNPTTLVKDAELRPRRWQFYL